MAKVKATTVCVGDQGQIILPEAIRAAAQVTADTTLLVELAADGSIRLRLVPDPDQAWFWTEEWQAGEREAFREAVAKFVADLKAGRFRAGLRVKAVQGHPGVHEITWAPDGRATFAFGRAVRPSDLHVVWRHVGSHDILTEP